MNLFTSVVGILLTGLLLTVTGAARTDDTYRCPQTVASSAHLYTFDGKCFQFVKNEVQWQQARQTCRNLGGDLISITSRQIQDFVEQVMRGIWNRNGMWIGASDSVSEGQWYWVNGQRVSSGYQNWASGQPSCQFLCLEDCACLRKDDGYKWHDKQCSSPLNQYGFACQFNIIPATTPSTTSIAAESSKTLNSTARVTTSAAVPNTTTIRSIASTAMTSTSTTRAVASTPTQTNAADSNTTNSSSPAVSKTIFELNTKSADTKMTEPGTGTAENLRGLSDTDKLNKLDSQPLSLKEEGMNIGVIVGLIVSFMLAFVASLSVGILFCRRKRNKTQHRESADVGYNNTLYCDEHCKEPAHDICTYIHAVEDNSDDNGYADIKDITRDAESSANSTCSEVRHCQDKTATKSYFKY